MMIQMVIVLSVLGSYVVVMSDEVSLTDTIPPGYGLQDYLCSGPLKSNTTVVLDDGEHRISSEPPCTISNEGNITITGSSNTTVRCEGEGRVLRFNSVQKLSLERMTFMSCLIELASIENTVLTDCTFQDALDGSAVRLYGSTGNVSITHCTFQNNSAAVGGAVWLGGSPGNVSITYCTFQNNSAAYDGGAVWLFESTGNVSITYCTFQDNSATRGGGGAVGLSRPIDDVSITYCTFQNNSAADGGAVSLYESTGNVSITYCTFQDNSATRGGGGAVGLWGSTGSVSITYNYCTFQYNSASYGGAVALDGSIIFNGSTSNGGANAIIIYNSTFTNNSAVSGAAVYAKDRTNSKGEPLGHLLLQDVVIKDNQCSGGGAIYFDGVKVNIFGNTPTGSQFSSNSGHGAIQGQNGYLLLHGNIAFTENRGVNGGAISLSNKVPLYFYEGCAVEFSRNVATTSGGAIYNDGEKNQAKGGSTCIIAFIYNDPVHFPDAKTFSITFINNHAVQSGHAVYATPIYNCNNNCFYNDYRFECNNGPNLTSYFTITSSPGDSCDLKIVTSPTDVHLCGCSDPKLCNVPSQYQGKVTTYPGGTVRLNVTSVGAGNTLSPSVVYTQIDTSSSTSQNITLGPRQEAQWIRTVCGTIEYQIYGPEMASAKPLLFNDPINSAAVIEVELLPCEPGFVLMSDFSTGVIKCDCSLFFTSRGVVCDTSDGTVIRNDKNNWIGVYNNTLPALASTCPMDYCNTAINRLSLSRSGDLCNGGRTGILCGHCHSNHSVIFGSSKCQVCIDMWLITLVMFAVLGVLLVAALFFPNLTITQGTLYGLIFYANIIQVNHSIFFSQSILNHMKVIVSFVNLDVGLPLCFMYVWFYDGNVKYLHGKHTVLFVVAMVTCTLFLLPYTFALTFIPIIEHYSEHNRLFNYLHKKANQMKPMIDAHYAPYKGEW